MKGLTRKRSERPRASDDRGVELITTTRFLLSPAAARLVSLRRSVPERRKRNKRRSDEVEKEIAS